MLKLSDTVATPDFDRSRNVKQIVNMPVPGCLGPSMSQHTGTDATRAERASDINIIARIYLKQTVPAHLYLLRRSATKNQRIGARPGPHDAARRLDRISRIQPD